MTPSGSFPFAQHLSIRHPRWGRAFARPQDSELESLPCIPGYRVERLVGEGRMALAYLAQDTTRGGKVVLKLLRPEHLHSDARMAAFLQEFAIPSAIRNPHVIRVVEQSAGEAHAYIAMEYLGGGDLARLIRCGLTASESLSLLRQAAIALAELHRAGFVHCDVKPANLLLRYSGDLVLADFGLARSLGSIPQTSPAGLVVGTPCYASPELAQGGPVHAAADVYSLGVVLYEMLCGKPPFPGHTLMEVFCQHLMAPVPRLPRELVWLQPLVDLMLEKQVRRRLPDGQALLRQIDQIEGAGPLHPAPHGASGSRCQT
ncbi:MAG: Serine/threonine protein kinaserelated protein [Ramlibacter sp.]|nr:Serine/threonine protein kinaserelated protein [Ramlibacter sp.]